MKEVIIVVFGVVILATACQKSSDSARTTPNNNEIRAAGILSTGQRIEVNLDGDKAVMGTFTNGLFSYYTGIRGGNPDSPHLVITVYPPVTTTGTYSDSTYQLDFYLNQTVLYSNYYNGNSGFIRHTGSVIFTTCNNSQWEGSFTATCKRFSQNTDSMVVSGTFRGNTIVH